MTVPPDTRFAYNGDFGLAYQVLGDGPSDLLYLPGWVGNVEANWLAPDHARFLERLASFSRLIVMDRRGTGCSDRLSPGQARPSLPREYGSPSRRRGSPASTRRG